MGDIDVMRTLSELKERGLVKRSGNRVQISSDRYKETMESFIVSCLLSDIDKNFYVQVASSGSLKMYRDVKIIPFMKLKDVEDTPITLMRLVVEGRGKDLENHYLGTCQKFFPQCE
jgi:hypothetical protein